MNILVTGANGFIGKALTIKLLSEGFDVYAIVSSKEDMNDLECEKLHVFELLFDNYDKISELISINIDIAYHFAWRGLNGAEARNVDIQLQNVEATMMLLNQLKSVGIGKFVFASTMNVLEVIGALTKPLDYSPRGTHIHVASKINAEIVARTFCYENNIDFNEGIIAMAYGEGNKSKMVPNVFIYSLQNGIIPKLVEGNNSYDIIYIADIVDAFYNIGFKGINKKTYYIGHDWDKTFKELFLEIKDILKPDALIEFGSRPDDNAIDFERIDRSALTKDTGWEPNYDFKQSILNTAKWIKESGFKIDG